MRSDAHLPIVSCDFAPSITVWSRQQNQTTGFSAHSHVIILRAAAFKENITEIKRPYIERINETLTRIHDAFGVRLSWVGRMMAHIAAFGDATLTRRLLPDRAVTDDIFWFSVPRPQLTWGIRMRHLVGECVAAIRVTVTSHDPGQIAARVAYARQNTRQYKAQTASHVVQQQGLLNNRNNLPKVASVL